MMGWLTETGSGMPMYKIQFFVGLPHASPRQQIAEAMTMHDDADKAFAEAKQKADFVQTLLRQQITGRPDEWQPPIEDDADYADGKLTDAARQRLTGEHELSLWGPKPLPSRDVKAHLPPPVIEVQMTSDDGQLTLVDVKPNPVGPKAYHEWRPSGDYRATITYKELDLGTLDFVATTASHALGIAVERARTVIAQLKKEPKLGFLRFQDVHIHVERVNTQISFVKDQPDFDWRHMEFPTPHF